MLGLDGVALHVAFYEADIAYTFGLGVGTAVLQECIATIDAEHGPFGTDTLGDLYCRIAEAAAYVHRFVARSNFQLRKYVGAMMVQAADENVTVLGEFRHQNVVPKIDKLVTAGRCRRRAHDLYSVVVGFDGDTLHRDCVRTISPQAPIVSIVSAAGIAIPGNKGAHVKAHLLGTVLVGYPHRTGPSSEATAAQAIGATGPVHVTDANGNVVALG